MNEIKERIILLGLTSTEADIYLAGLSHVEVSVQELAKETGIKRPTIYHALETLVQKGLVAKKGTEARRIFHMSAPERLEQFLQGRIAQLEDQKKELGKLLPLLQTQMGNTDDGTMDVLQYEGIEGVKMVVEEALYCKKRHWDIIAPKVNFFSEFDKEYARYYLNARRRRRITSRSLWEKVSKQESSASQIQTVTPEVVRERNPRYLPKNMHGMFSSVMILFDDKVAFISSYKNLSAILIHSSEIHQFMRAMFEGLWHISEEPT